MKNIQSAILSIVLCGCALWSCGQPEKVEPLKPTVEITVDEITASGCRVVYTLNADAAYYQTVNLTAAEFGALSAAQLAETIGNSPKAYAASKYICCLSGSNDFVVAAIPYSADGTVAGEVRSVRYSLGTFDISGKLYNAEREAEYGHTVHNTLYLDLTTAGRAVTGEYALTTSADLASYKALHGESTYLADFLAEYGRSFTEQQLENMDNANASKSYIANIFGLSDGVAYSFVCMLGDAAGNKYYKVFEGSTEEIILLDGYRRILGDYTQAAYTYLSTTNNKFAINSIDIKVSIKAKNESFTVSGLSGHLTQFGVSLDKLDMADGSQSVCDEVTAYYDVEKECIYFQNQWTEAKYKGAPVAFFIVEGAISSPAGNVTYINKLYGYWDQTANGLLFDGRTTSYTGYVFAADRYNGTGTSYYTDFNPVSKYVLPYDLIWSKKTAAPSPCNYEITFNDENNN